MADSSVTVVIVNYRSGDDLSRCLPGVLEAGSLLDRVVVFDNASGDESWREAEHFAKSDNRVEIIESTTNLGLAGAVNQILPTLTTEYLAILNPDSTPMQGWLDPLVAALNENGNAGAACPLILMEENGEVNSAGQHVHVTGLGFNRFLHARPGDVGIESHLVGGIHGSAFVVRTEMLRGLGGWDSTGFLYHEDVALSWDLALSGYDIICVPSSRVLHDYHLTMYPEKLYLLERNRWALLLSHLRAGRLLKIAPALILTELMVWGLSLIRGGRFIRAKLRSYRWIMEHRDEIAGWRQRVFSRGKYDTRRLRRHTRWTYPVNQIGILGRERGESSRQPPGGLPV